MSAFDPKRTHALQQRANTTRSPSSARAISVDGTWRPSASAALGHRRARRRTRWLPPRFASIMPSDATSTHYEPVVMPHEPVVDELVMAGALMVQQPGAPPP